MKRKIRDILVWLMILCKRLLKRPSFVALIILIPISAFALRLSISEDSGVLRIGIFSEGSEIGDSIKAELLSRDSIVSFTEYSSEEEARKAVMSDKIHGAWIFPADLGERITQNAQSGSTKPLVKVIEREETIPLKLSHELLYGTLHPYVAYSTYESFTEKKYGSIIPVDKQELKYHFETAAPVGDILVMKVVGEEEQLETSSGFLIFPLRGILSLLCVLCGLASVMFFLYDRACGKFDRMPPSKHIIPAFGSCFAGVFMSAIAVLISVFLIGIGTHLLTEIAAMLLYIICVCGFCLICGALLGRAERLGVVIPFVMIVMMIQCPVFLNADSLRPLWLLFPPSYYLYAVYDKAYMGYMVLYAVISYAVLLVLNLVLNRTPAKK